MMDQQHDLRKKGVAVPHSHEELFHSFAQLALKNIIQEYPNKLDHVLGKREDALTPQELHPVFYGSYDWHSAVHMHWLLVRTVRLFPSISDARDIVSALSAHFTREGFEKETAYLNRQESKAFERPYGWAWYLKLSQEVTDLSQASVVPQSQKWAAVMKPLAKTITERFLEFLPKAAFPVRAGTHANSAFALLLGHGFAASMGEAALKEAIETTAANWFLKDRKYPAHYEPSGDDFLSPALTEAALMRATLDPIRFRSWWEDFVPDGVGLEGLLQPVEVSDPSDPKLCHLHGLNLSRAWCWGRIISALPAEAQFRVKGSIQAHLDASLPAAQGGPYVGTHWLASFAALALADDYI